MMMVHERVAGWVVLVLEGNRALNLTGDRHVGLVWGGFRVMYWRNLVEAEEWV